MKANFFNDGSDRFKDAQDYIIEYEKLRLTKHYKDSIVNQKNKLKRTDDFEQIVKRFRGKINVVKNFKFISHSKDSIINGQSILFHLLTNPKYIEDKVLTDDSFFINDSDIYHPEPNPILIVDMNDEITTKRLSAMSDNCLLINLAKYYCFLEMAAKENTTRRNIHDDYLPSSEDIWYSVTDGQYGSYDGQDLDWID